MVRIKPTPDELLIQLESEEGNLKRGRLKVFLGYASGVGKSFRMFDEGRRRRERGQDVIVGAIQPLNSPELALLIQHLEILPMRQVSGISVIDVGRIVSRQPQVCLVDGLAYDNAPGNKNQYRWQDVEDLLAAGISVITTVNLEFIAEFQEEVSAIRGKKASTSVPLAFLHKAEEVVVVDAPASYELSRLKSSYVDAPLMAKEAKLSQLREIALLVAADVVDKQLECYLFRNGIPTSWGTQERILVCLTSHSPAARMLQRAHLAQQRFHGALFALYVRTGPLRAKDQEILQHNLQLARDVEAEVAMVEGEDEVHTIVEFARRHRITQLYIGHSPVPAWQLWFWRTTADRIIHAAEGIDVKLFPN
jgi:two-component system sensor histidine kinase KdpD